MCAKFVEERGDQRRSMLGCERCCQQPGRESSVQATCHLSIPVRSLQLRKVCASGLVTLSVVAEVASLQLQLLGDESEHCGRRLFAFLQDPSREAEVTEQHSETEAVRVTPPAINQRQVLRTQRVVANHAALVRGRRSECEPLRLAQELSARHGCPF